MDLNAGIRANIVLSKFVGLWPVGPPILYKLYTIILLINMYLYNISCIIFVAKNINNTDELTAAVFSIFGTIAAAIKATIFNIKFGKIEELVDLFKEAAEFQPRNKVQEKIFKKGIFVSSFVFYYFLSTAILTGFAWVLIPILNKERGFPSKAWFPDSFVSTGYYLATYIWQSVIIFYHILVNVAMDALFANLMIQIGDQCQALNEQISGLEGPHIDEDLLKCITRHKLVLRVADLMGQGFGAIVLVLYSTTILTLCLTMFLLSLMETVNATFIMLLIFQFAVLLQLFLYCWFGNRVFVYSDTLYYSAFSCKWYENSTISFKKNLLFFMQKLQKPIILYVGNIFPVNIITFTSILRSSWAYFMALRNVNSS